MNWQAAVRRAKLVGAFAIAVSMIGWAAVPARHSDREHGDHLSIIDAHLHVQPIPSRMLGPVLRNMDENDIVLALLMANDSATVAQAHAKAPNRFVIGVALPCPGGRDPNPLPCFAKSNGWPNVKWLRSAIASGTVGAIGELYYVYYGMQPTDPRLEPYWAAAEDLDVPVVVHTGRRPKSTLAPGCCKGYNDDLGDPALLEPVLEKHPKLRISLAHVGGRFIDQAIALMKKHSNVYGDLSIMNEHLPTPVLTAQLKRFRDEGLLNRIMFGSDNVDYSVIIPRTNEALASFTEQERRGVFCRNAARFLRLKSDICGPAGPAR